MKANSKGFTLIELVVVIIILGILGAVALPRLINIQGDARSAVMRNVEGSMRATNALIYSKASVLGLTGATGTLTAAQMGTTGPAIGLAYGYAANLTELRDGMDLTPVADFTTVGNVLQHARASDPTTCTVTYGPSALVGGIPRAPTYTTAATSAGCR